MLTEGKSLWPLNCYAQEKKCIICLLYLSCTPPTSGILSDLFPGVSIPEHDYGVLQSTIEESLVLRNLQPLPCMTKKVQGDRVLLLLHSFDFV